MPILVELPNGDLLNALQVSMWYVEPHAPDNWQEDAEGFVVGVRLACGSTITLSKFPTETLARAYLNDLIDMTFNPKSKARAVGKCAVTGRPAQFDAEDKEITDEEEDDE